jgi:DNA-directed RNA polymerase specialized sigma24 family protein
MVVDLVTALTLLPEAHAAALRLRVAGASTAEVADALGLDHSAVQPLLILADAKLRDLLLTEDAADEIRGHAFGPDREE